MQYLINRAEEWLKDRGGYDGYSEHEIAVMITALVERVEELEAALEQIIYEADKYKDSAASELVSIARKALGRG